MTRIRRLIIGYIIGGHIMGIVGAYLIASGINRIPISIAEENKISKISNIEETLIKVGLAGGIC